jgi:DNA-binding PadR family transcriptional regulator
MTRESLGEFEHQVLLAALRLGPDAYTAEIVLALEKLIEREVAPAAVYIALRRLEDGGLVESEMRKPAGTDGSRQRRYFEVTGTGLEALRRSRSRFLRLWSGLEPLLTEE